MGADRTDRILIPPCADDLCPMQPRWHAHPEDHPELLDLDDLDEPDEEAR